MAQPPMLPSMQQLESQNQIPQMQHHHALQPAQYTPPPPHQQPVPNGPLPHPQHAGPLPVYPAPSAPHPYSNGINGVNGHANGHMKVLYPLPPQGGEPRPTKREIKRRTKTGCMTCRRRRIKCDEGHPACRNCQKSKRECLGYDPIFKSQGPGAVQPPSSQSIPGQAPIGSPSDPGASRPPSAHMHAYPQSHPASPNHTFAPPPTGAHPTPPPSLPSQSFQHPSNSDSALDPALSSLAAATGPSPPPPPPLQPPPQEVYTAELRSYRKRKHIYIEETFIADGIPLSVIPSFEPSTPPPAAHEMAEIKSLWHTVYAPNLDAFFETSWYGASGEQYLQHSQSTIQFFAHCAKLFRERAPPASPEAAAVPSLEIRLIWQLATMARQAWAARQSADTVLADLLHRLDVIEHLVTGQILPINLIPPAPQPPKRILPDVRPKPEFISASFWHHLGYMCAQDDTIPSFDGSSPATAGLTSSMAAMRQLLDMKENRDVLYSIAIARHLGGRLDRLDADKVLATPNPGDQEHPLTKTSIAMTFLSREESSGTNGVVRGFAGIGRRGVIRAWVKDDTPPPRSAEDAVGPERRLEDEGRPSSGT